jgi:hypothetical protein
VRRVIAGFWRDSRAAVYAVLAAVVISSWGLVRVHGFPHTRADWTIVGWAAAAAALGALARYADPLVASLSKRLGSAAVGGRSLLTQAQVQALVDAGIKAELDRVDARVRVVPPPEPPQQPTA